VRALGRGLAALLPARELDASTLAGRLATFARHEFAGAKGEPWTTRLSVARRCGAAIAGWAALAPDPVDTGAAAVELLEREMGPELADHAVRKAFATSLRRTVAELTVFLGDGR
jgi:hypothetical protein